MKSIFLFALLLTKITSPSWGQAREPVNLHKIVREATRDSAGVWQLINSSIEYSFKDPDAGLMLAEEALTMAKDIHFKRGEAEALNYYGEAFHFKGDYPRALQLQFEALRINRELNDQQSEANTLGLIGIVYNHLGAYRQALQFLLPATKIFKQLQDTTSGTFVLSVAGDTYDFLKIPDSALYYQRLANKSLSASTNPHVRSYLLRSLGNIYFEFGKKDSAMIFYKAGIKNCRQNNDLINMSMIQKKMAEVFASNGQYDSSLHYARQAFKSAAPISAKLQVLEASDLLATRYHEQNHPDSAYFYLDIAGALKDSLYGPEKYRKLQRLMLEEQQQQQLIIRQGEQYKSNVKYSALLAAVVISIGIAFMLLRNNRQKQKANDLLVRQKSKIETTLTDLKSAQAQLIQREKMASLGELTAGIAHEIQNPLNFVNNFSDVNRELIDEMEQALEKGNHEIALALAKDVKENEATIIHHGKRAEAVVKGMLQHSRSGGGARELTDINMLADESFRFAYHGLRAKDNMFKATMATEFDTSLGKINVVPQDIGRVLLNLISNAFYAVTEKIKSADSNYEPTVSVATRKIEKKLEITVKDNGNGIREEIIDKIFQPFFTTKPTGQGTGLGLSLSYDIVKAHGGELNVETKVGESSVFTIVLPDA